MLNMCKSKNPVEHPSRISLFTNAIASLPWASQSYKASLDVIFLELSKLAYAEIEYYYGKRVSSRRISGICRFLAWLLGSIGILVPLLKPVFGEHLPSDFLSWGYVAFGFSGVILLFDSLFSGTQAHQRYTTSQLELEKTFTVFSLEWQARTVKLSAEPTAASAIDLLERSVVFVNEIHRVLGVETSSWQEAVNKSLEELKGKITTGNGG